MTPPEASDPKTIYGNTVEGGSSGGCFDSVTVGTGSPETPPRGILDIIKTTTSTGGKLDTNSFQALMEKLIDDALKPYQRGPREHLLINDFRVLYWLAHVMVGFDADDIDALRGEVIPGGFGKNARVVLEVKLKGSDWQPRYEFDWDEL
jgi:hypothetical protein